MFPPSAALLAAVCAMLAACATSFDGSIDAWTRVGEAQWSRTAGVIEPQPESGAGYLLLPGVYSNVQLQVEFWVAPDTNSGVFLRCIDPSNISPDTCYEFNIWDQHPNPSFRTGSIVTIAEPEAIVHTVNRWNRMVITANGHYRDQ